MGIKIIKTEHPMRWYQFVVYFQLFAFAVVYVLQGMMHLQGLFIGFGTAEALYTKHPMLKNVEVVMAVIGFLIAFFSIVARQLLWYFKVWGPKVYLIVMALSGFYGFLYDAFASIVIGLPIFTAYDIGGVISTIIIVFLCWTYFHKRADLFVN